MFVELGREWVIQKFMFLLVIPQLLKNACPYVSLSSWPPPPNRALAISLNICIVRSSFSFNPANLTSLSAFLALRISSFLISLSFFLRSFSLFILLTSPKLSSSPITSASRRSTSPPASFDAENARFESASSRFFSSWRSRVPASARGASSSNRAFCSLRSRVRCCCSETNCEFRA
jgi:hypothetical protein